MNVTAIMQKILDETLLPFGVLSNHLRRVEADNIANSQVKINGDEYVVYKIVSNRPKTYGDGKAKTRRVYIDVNYYTCTIKPTPAIRTLTNA